MKRRGFLSLLGAALTAPMMPTAAVSSTAGLAARAATHARSFPYVSAMGLSRALDVPMQQAQALLIDLSRKGLVGPISSTALGPIHAASEVFRPAVSAVVRGTAARQAAKAAQTEARVADKPSAPATWIAHLQAMCVAQGFTLQPRALAVVA